MKVKRGPKPRSGAAIIISQSLQTAFPERTTAMAAATENPLSQNCIHDLDSLLHDLSQARPPPIGSTCTSKKVVEQHCHIEQVTTIRQFKGASGSTTGAVTNCKTSQSDPTAAPDDLSGLSMGLNCLQLSSMGSEMPVPDSSGLDEMLDHLHERLVKQSVHRTSTTKGRGRGPCFACQKPVFGRVVSAMGKVFHPEHFVCGHCHQELQGHSFFEKAGVAYCERDYQALFSPQCAGCEQPIMEQCVTALGRTWHPHHLICSDCGCIIGDGDKCLERKGGAVCESCFQAACAIHCAGCGLPVRDNYVWGMDAGWHAGCFVCVVCQQPLVDDTFHEMDGRVYCQLHFHSLRGSSCAGCDRPITGRCVTAMSRKFHPEHFVCCFCLKQLNKGTFKEQADKPYCHHCYHRLFR